MKQYLILLFLTVYFFTGLNTFAQTDNLTSQVDSLRYLSGDPFDCDAITWRIIANKKDAIQALIDKLDDTTVTLAKHKCKSSNLSVADIAYLSLTKIVSLPFFAVTGMQCDIIEKGCQVGIFDYMEMHRAKFKKQVQTYYNIQKNTLKWHRFDSNHMTSCHFKNHIYGQYE